MQHTTLNSVLQVFRIQHTNNTPSLKVYGIVPWFRQTVPGLSPQKSGLDPRPVHVGFAVNKMALQQVLLHILHFSHLS